MRRKAKRTEKAQRKTGTRAFFSMLQRRDAPFSEIFKDR